MVHTNLKKKRHPSDTRDEITDISDVKTRWGKFVMMAVLPFRRKKRKKITSCTSLNWVDKILKIRRRIRVNNGWQGCRQMDRSSRDGESDKRLEISICP